MKKTMSIIAAAAVSVALLGGCAGSDWNNSDTGTVLGGDRGLYEASYCVESSGTYLVEVSLRGEQIGGASEGDIDDEVAPLDVGGAIGGVRPSSEEDVGADAERRRADRSEQQRGTQPARAEDA